MGQDEERDWNRVGTRSDMGLTERADGRQTWNALEHKTEEAFREVVISRKTERKFDLLI